MMPMQPPTQPPAPMGGTAMPQQVPMDPMGMAPPPNGNDNLPIPGGEHIDIQMVTQGVQPLPIHRLTAFYNSWENSKGQELRDGYRWDGYYTGNQHFTPEQRKTLKARKQPDTYQNEVAKKVNAYLGVEQKLRRDPRAYPNTPVHEQEADAITGCLRYVDQACNTKKLVSMAAKDYYVRGIGALFQGVERNKKNEVNVAKRNVPAINFIYDPRSSAHDFSDAKFLGEWAWMDSQDAEDLFLKLGRVDSAKKCAQLHGLASQAGSVPGEWARLNASWFSRELMQIRIVHLYYKHHGQWWCTYFCNSIELYNAPSVYKDQDTGESYCPFHATSYGVDEIGNRYGAVKDLAPLQDEVNARRTKLLWLLNARQMVYQKGVVADPNKAQREAQKADGMIELNPHEGTEKKFQIITFDAEIKGQSELLNQSLQAIQNYGPNPAIMGKGDGVDNQSGRAILARQNAGMVEMAPQFDRLREFRLEGYKRDWRLIRQFWTEEKMIRVLDEEAEAGLSFITLNKPTGQFSFNAQGQPVEQLENNVAEIDVDITLEEGPDSITTNEELFEVASKLGEAMLSPLGKIMIELSNAPNKRRLMKMMDDAAPKPDPKEVELQDKKNFLEVASLAAKLDEVLAKVEKTRADTLGVMTTNMIPSEAFQLFPLDFGVRSNFEDFLGQDVHQNGNPNAFLPPPQMEQVPMQEGAPDAMGNPGAPSPAMERPKQGPMITQAPTAQSQQQMPGEEPQMGAPGGLPMPGPNDPMAQALDPPPGTRA